MQRAAATPLFDLPGLQALRSSQGLQGLNLVHQPVHGDPEPLGGRGSAPLYLVNPSVLSRDSSAVRVSRYSYCSPLSNRTSSAIDRFRAVHRAAPGPFTEASAWIDHGRVRAMVHGAEDMRLFRLGGRAHAVFNRRTYATAPSRCCNDQVNGTNAMFMAELESHYREARLVYEESRAVEKNWAPFVVHGQLYMSYSICPHVVLRCESDLSRPDGGRCVKAHSTEHVACRRPELRGVRGGSPLLRVGAHLVGVAHRSWERRMSEPFDHSDVASHIAAQPVAMEGQRTRCATKGCRRSPAPHPAQTSSHLTTLSAVRNDLRDRCAHVCAGCREAFSPWRVRTAITSTMSTPSILRRHSPFDGSGRLSASRHSLVAPIGMRCSFARAWHTERTEVSCSSHME